VVVFAAPPAEVPEPIPPDDGYSVQLQEVDRRLAIKQSLVKDLAAGRRGLRDVAARFADLDRGRREIESAVNNFPGATAGERYCRLVIGHVDAAINDDGRRSAVLARLDAELTAILAGGGRVPSVGSSP
jgi:hypothetical protein